MFLGITQWAATLRFTAVDDDSAVGTDPVIVTIVEHGGL